MSTNRYFNTSFWTDTWIQSLDPSERLSFIYFITNPLTNIAGVYKISINQICFDLGFNDVVVKEIINRFEKYKKIAYFEEYIIIVNFPKFQKWQTMERIKIGIDNIINALPESVLNKLIEIGYKYPLSPKYIDSMSVNECHNYINSNINNNINNNTEEPIHTPEIVIEEKEGFDFVKIIRKWNSYKTLIPENELTFLQSHKLKWIYPILKPYSMPDILQAIENLDIVLSNPKNFWFTTRQDIYTWVKNNFTKFLEFNDPEKTFKKEVKK